MNSPAHTRVGLRTALLVCTLAAGCSWYRHTPVEMPPAAAGLHTVEPLDTASFPPAVEPPPASRPATPPAELSLTLEECRAAALANNLEIEAALIDPAIARARVSEEEARFEAVFQTSLTQTLTDTPAAGHHGTQARLQELETGVEMPLRTGGSLRFDLADRRRTTDPDGPVDPAYEPSATVSISQPLLRNAGRRAATHPIRLALYGERIAQAATRLEIIRVLALVDRVYWRLYAARRVLEVRRQDYTLAERQLETARRLVASGERSPVEVLRAEAALAERLEGIITAETVLRDRQRDLKRVINRPDLPLDSETVILPATEPDPVHYRLDARSLVGRARANRMELLELELQLAQDDSTIEYLRNQVLPLVMVEYAYSLTGLGDSRADAYERLETRRFSDHRAGVRLVVPLGNEAAESRLRQALLTRRQRLRTRADREALVEQEVLAAADSLEAAWQRLLAARQSVLLAHRLLEAEQRQFELGLNTSNDVLSAQTRLASAQSAEIEALTQYQIALVDMAYATGTVLGAARVRWQEDGALTDSR